MDKKKYILLLFFLLILVESNIGYIQIDYGGDENIKITEIQQLLPKNQSITISSTSEQPTTGGVGGGGCRTFLRYCNEYNPCCDYLECIDNECIYPTENGTISFKDLFIQYLSDEKINRTELIDLINSASNDKNLKSMAIYNLFIVTMIIVVVLLIFFAVIRKKK